MKTIPHRIFSNIWPLVDEFLIYALLTAMVYALFPPIMMNRKAESANFFAFRMYEQRWLIYGQVPQPTQ